MQEQKKKFFKNLRSDLKKVSYKKEQKKRELETLPKAPVVPKQPSEEEIKAKKEQTEYFTYNHSSYPFREVLRNLRVYLRGCVEKLHKKRKLHLFFKNVVSHYWNVGAYNAGCKQTQLLLRRSESASRSIYSTR